MTIKIKFCTRPAELYDKRAVSWAGSQSWPHPAHLRLQLDDGVLSAHSGNEPEDENDGQIYSDATCVGIPVITADAVNRLMREILPLVERIAAGADLDYDDPRGEDRFTRSYVFDEDAYNAIAEVHERVDLYGDDPNQGFETGDLVEEVELDDVVDGNEADRYGITGVTTDERLDEIADDILAEVAARGEYGAAGCDGLDEYLRKVREDLAIPPTAADVLVARERLGLTPEHLARLLDVTPETVTGWERGGIDDLPVPERLRVLGQLEELEKATAEAVEDIYKSFMDKTLVVYRTDEEYRAAHPDSRWSAGWHRRMCMRIADRDAWRTRVHFVYADGQE